jgi:hypothetical protein
MILPRVGPLMAVLPVPLFMICRQSGVVLCVGWERIFFKNLIETATACPQKKQASLFT